MTAPELILLEDMDLYALETTDPLVQIEQDIIHRLIETPGSNPDDPSRGLGLEDQLSGPFDPQLARRCETECRKDQRLTSVKVEITQTDSVSFRIDLELEVDGAVLGVVLIKDAAGVRRVLQ